MPKKVIAVTDTAETKAATTIRKCTCVHKFQDEIYGVGNRAQNLMGKNVGWRCTVCSHETKLGGLK